MVILPGELIAQFRGYLDADDGYIYGTAGVMWTEAKQKAATREQTVKYGAQWIGHMVEDCSGAFVRAFKALGSSIYHGSNTMYLRYCTDKGKLKNGKRADGEPLKPGTAVFVWNAEDQKYGHVGLYVGDGLVIEAAGTRQGVIQGKVSNSKWTNWGELKGVDYTGGGGGVAPVNPDDDPGEYHPLPHNRPTLRKGSVGQAVKELQQMLLERGYDLGICGADGDFGKATENAVKKFQRDHGLTADGVVGKKTWAALDAQTGDTYTVTVNGLTLCEAQNIATAFPQAIIERV